MLKRRRRVKQTVSLRARLAAFAKAAREKASLLPPGAEKDDLLKKAREAEKRERHRTRTKGKSM